MTRAILGVVLSFASFAVLHRRATVLGASGAPRAAATFRTIAGGTSLALLVAAVFAWPRNGGWDVAALSTTVAIMLAASLIVLASPFFVRGVAVTAKGTDSASAKDRAIAKEPANAKALVAKTVGAKASVVKTGIAKKGGASRSLAYGWQAAALLIGTLPLGVAGGVCVARYLPVTDEVRFGLGYLTAVPLWISAACALAVLGSARRALTIGLLVTAALTVLAIRW